MNKIFLMNIYLRFFEKMWLPRRFVSILSFEVALGTRPSSRNCPTKKFEFEI
jgi:hypothetical protein